ncbi:hypothetical protein K438DRAFT_1816665 [Mycena galopus ATCC 62051]|nr:hypothetical protein K438DRAFT_1816665 [Mycena galopus ATCC 62051]
MLGGGCCFLEHPQRHRGPASWPSPRESVAKLVQTPDGRRNGGRGAPRCSLAGRGC